MHGSKQVLGNYGCALWEEAKKDKGVITNFLRDQNDNVATLPPPHPSPIVAMPKPRRSRPTKTWHRTFLKRNWWWMLPLGCAMTFLLWRHLREEMWWEEEEEKDDWKEEVPRYNDGEERYKKCLVLLYKQLSRYTWFFFAHSADIARLIVSWHHNYTQHWGDPSYDRQCRCRKLPPPPPSSSSSTSAPLSTCSDAATARGGRQKVISFSIFGAVRPYFAGIVENLRAMTA